jgi:hypothetical protein
VIEVAFLSEVIDSGRNRAVFWNCFSVGNQHVLQEVKRLILVAPPTSASPCAHRVAVSGA